MDKKKILEDIFSDDPLGLLKVKAKSSTNRTADERLTTSFDEINDFMEKNEREPEPNPGNVSEYKLYSRLKGLRENIDKMMVLEPQDKYGLLKTEKKEIESFDDILGDDSLDLLGDNEEGLFDFKHTPKEDARANADFVARRKPCKDFDQFESTFKKVQQDLASGKRKMFDFREDNLQEGSFYVHNGVLLLLESVEISKEEQTFSSGKRKRTDGRTRCIFENGTESNMLYRSLAKILYTNGKVVSHNEEKTNEDFLKEYSNIGKEDEVVGYIYVLKSKSEVTEISSIENLYKIGYSKIDVQERIKNAENETTYLMAPVKIEGAWECYNMNPQKFENLIHKFFGEACLKVDVNDKDGERHTPREWFIVPFEVIEKAIELIITGRILDFEYSVENERIMKKYGKG
jgi:hypothetical protein